MSWPPFATILLRMASVKHRSVLAVLLGLLLGFGFSLPVMQARAMDAAISLPLPAHAVAMHVDQHPCNDCGDRGGAAKMDCAAPACAAAALAVMPQRPELRQDAFSAKAAFAASPLPHGLILAPDPKPPRQL